MQSQPCLFPRVSKDLGAELSRHTGFRRSYSGSEAEESTSTENLTHEEKYVLRNSTRQDPQGEETLLSDKDKSPDQSSFNTLIVHQDPAEPTMGSNKPHQQRAAEAPSMYYVDADPPSGSSNENSYYQHQYHHHPYAAAYRFEHPVQVQEITDIPKHYLDQSEVLKHLAKEVQGPYIVPKSPGMLASPPGEQHHHLYHYHHHHHHHLQQQQQQQQRQMLLQQQMPQEQTHPPPDYQKWHAVDGGRMSLEANVEDDRKVNADAEEKTEKLSISRSQPDLRHLGIGRCWDECSLYTSHRPKTRGRASSSESGNERGGNRTLHMLELLAEENQALKAELAMYHRKVSRLRKFELEIQKVHQSHEELVQSSEKRERLQHAIRVKLEMEIAKLRDLNRILKSQLDAATKRQSQGIDGSDLWKELSRRDAFASQLLQQNKELMAAKERHEIELAAQRATLHEQRTHIDVLDKALSNAQASAVRMEEECQKKQLQVDKVGQLQASLTSLQLVSDRREQVETKLKNQLEGEIRELRRELQVSRDVGGRRGGEDRETGSLLLDSGVTVAELKKLTREKDERIVTLEAEVSKWEQRYLEESALRQIAINAASMPKDAKIAALERTSQESEKLIAQARLEKLKQMDELHATNKKCADLEARIKDLESNVAERDVTIKVLRKHSREKDVVYQNAMLRSPRHVPHRSIATTDERPSVSKDIGRAGICPPTLTRSLSGPTLNGEACVEDDIGTSNLALCSVSRSVVGGSTMTLPAKKKSFDESKNSLDEQLKQLDSQLLSKDSIIQALRAEKEKFPNHYWRV